MATCKSCGAEILWVTTPTGKNAPVDAKPEKRWVEVKVILEGRPDTAEWVLVDTYLPHFATCPQASEHRKGRS